MIATVPVLKQERGNSVLIGLAATLAATLNLQKTLSQQKLEWAVPKVFLRSGLLRGKHTVSIRNLEEDVIIHSGWDWRELWSANTPGSLLALFGGNPGDPWPESVVCIIIHDQKVSRWRKESQVHQFRIKKTLSYDATWKECKKILQWLYHPCYISCSWSGIRCCVAKVRHHMKKFWQKRELLSPGQGVNFPKQILINTIRTAILDHVAMHFF